jgi:serine/threonine protein kinase
MKKAFEVFERKEKICIVMELCSGGDLYTRLPYSERDAAEITNKLCSAIAYMHSRGVVHRDCKFIFCTSEFRMVFSLKLYN